jgi:hypothetical protein
MTSTCRGHALNETRRRHSADPAPCRVTRYVGPTGAISAAGLLRSSACRPEMFVQEVQEGRPDRGLRLGIKARVSTLQAPRGPLELCGRSPSCSHDEVASRVNLDHVGVVGPAALQPLK